MLYFTLTEFYIKRYMLNTSILFLNSTSGIDECSAVCPSASLKNISVLSNCTIYFTATKPGVWYAISVQVSTSEDYNIYLLTVLMMSWKFSNWFYSNTICSAIRFLVLFAYISHRSWSVGIKSSAERNTYVSAKI